MFRRSGSGRKRFLFWRRGSFPGSTSSTGERCNSLPRRWSASRSTHGRAMSESWRMSFDVRSEEHTSELQSRLHLVCRLLLEKKKTTQSHMESVNYPYNLTIFQPIAGWAASDADRVLPRVL